MTDARTRIVQKATTDSAFRQALIANPKAVLAAELGAAVPDGLTITVVEDNANTVHLVLPPAMGSRELSDAELESVAGGTCNWQDMTSTACTF